MLVYGPKYGAKRPLEAFVISDYSIGDCAKVMVGPPVGLGPTRAVDHRHVSISHRVALRGPQPRHRVGFVNKILTLATQNAIVVPNIVGEHPALVVVVGGDVWGAYFRLHRDLLHPYPSRYYLRRVRVGLLRLSVHTALARAIYLQS